MYAMGFPAYPADLRATAVHENGALAAAAAAPVDSAPAGSLQASTNNDIKNLVADMGFEQNHCRALLRLAAAKVNAKPRSERQQRRLAKLNVSAPAAVRSAGPKPDCRGSLSAVDTLFTSAVCIHWYPAACRASAQVEAPQQGRAEDGVDRHRRPVPRVRRSGAREASAAALVRPIRRPSHLSKRLCGSVLLCTMARGRIMPMHASGTILTAVTLIMCLSAGNVRATSQCPCGARHHHLQAVECGSAQAGLVTGCAGAPCRPPAEARP